MCARLESNRRRENPINIPCVRFALRKVRSSAMRNTDPILIVMFIIKNTEHREYSPGQNTCLTLCAGSVVAPFICKCPALHYSVQSCDAGIFACAWRFGGLFGGFRGTGRIAGHNQCVLCVVWFWFREPPNRRIQPAVEINAIFIFSMNIQWNGGRNGIGFRII